MSAVTGVLKPVLGKLSALLGDKYKRFKGVRKDIKSLTHELAAMDAFLLKMSEEEDPDVQDKLWMNEVRELSYDVEDAIDDFILCVDDKDTKPDGFMEKINNLLGKMKAHRQIGSKMEDLKKQAIEVGERNARYANKSCHAFCNHSNKSCDAFSKNANATVDPRALAIFEHVSELVGINKPKAELIKLLTENNGCGSVQAQPKMVSIVGPGGMGKTTLANQAYQQLRGQFECQAFLSVSRKPDITNILRTILSKLSCQRYADTKEGSIQELISKTSAYLAEKRYFIVIDDIWDVKTWDVIKYAFPMNSPGMIITTTRMNDVAHSCSSSFSGHIYNMKPLCMDHSRQLFHRRLFNSKETCPVYLKKVSEHILQKCGGLPLAIIAISGLLANIEKTENLWNQVKDSIGRALERNPSIERMIKILSLSYFDLPPHLKSCFLYLSIFPEDTIIKKKALIWRWIAEGFVHKEARYTAYELGERCFNELINRSLIQPVGLDKYEKVLTCRVHDTILDFLVSKSIEENFVSFVGVPSLTIATESRVRRLSMQAEGKVHFVVPTSLVMSHVRSLNVFGDTVKIPSMMELRHLRVLDFGGCTQLKKHHLANVGRLFQLRYLNISRTRLRELPEQIGHLRCLEMLDTTHTQVSDLPSSIVNLGKMAHLLVSRLVRFPDGIVKMQALETLTLEVERLSHEDFCILGALPTLFNLSLGARKTQFSYGDEWLVVEAGFQSLKMFTYMLQGYRMDLFFAARCMPNLEKLEIVFFDNKSFSSAGSWYFGIKNLSSLVTFRCVLRCSGAIRSTHTIDTVKASLERAVSKHPNRHLTLIFDFRHCT